MSTTALFRNVCIDFDVILQQHTLKKMMLEVQKQAKTVEAKKRTDLGHYKDYGIDDWSPMYVGLFVEWLCENFLTYFGQQFNIGKVKMNASQYSTEEDLGTDGYAISLMNSRVNKTTVVKTGDKVYLQVKGTFNFHKEFTANDGSRIMNFVGNACSDAIKYGIAYSSRLVLFTTGDKIGYKLNNMSNGMIEVINYKKISKLMDDNIYFLNFMREDVGLKTLDVPDPQMDKEAAFNAKNI